MREAISALESALKELDEAKAALASAEPGDLDAIIAKIRDVLASLKEKTPVVDEG